MPFHALAYQFVCTNQYVNLSLCQLLKYLLDLFGCLGATQIFDLDGKVTEALAERRIVLQRQNGRRHQYCYLLAVGGHLEGCTHGYLRLAETYIAAYQSVHGLRTLQIVLHVQRCFGLIGRIFVDERCFQLMLHIAVGRVGEALLLLARGVQTNQVARYLLDLVFGAFLQSLPCTRTYARDCRHSTFLALVLADALQVMDAHEYGIAVAIDELNHLLWLAVHAGRDESAEASDAMVGVYHVVAYLQLVELL